MCLTTSYLLLRRQCCSDSQHAKPTQCGLYVLTQWGLKCYVKVCSAPAWRVSELADGQIRDWRRHGGFCQCWNINVGSVACRDVPVVEATQSTLHQGATHGAWEFLFYFGGLDA